jgi:hypothetical protein
MAATPYIFVRRNHEWHGRTDSAVEAGQEHPELLVGMVTAVSDISVALGRHS